MPPPRENASYFTALEVFSGSPRGEFGRDAFSFLERDDVLGAIQIQRMPFVLPRYTPPNFDAPELAEAPLAVFARALEDGVLPEGFHATSNHPEYIKLAQRGFVLLRESRMDAMVVRDGDELRVVEARNVRKGELVLLGRSEDGSEGIFVHPQGFEHPAEAPEKFAFRTRGTRETPFSRTYDELYELLRHERDRGYIVWVVGPAVVFDKDSRDSLASLVRGGYCHALLAGNAVATHDLEAGYFGTGLGQDIYTQEIKKRGHYHHLDAINRVRRAGSIEAVLRESDGPSRPGVMQALVERGIPFVLAGSIRDDGPLPEVEANVYRSQDAMRVHAKRATTVIALATQLHSIAVGNMLPSYRLEADGSVRPVYLVVVDMTEFSADKLANRGSGQATAILTNVQDFTIHLGKALLP